MYSGDDHSPFGCKAPPRGNDYDIKITSQMRKRTFGGNSETVYVHKNGNITYRGLNIDINNPYDTAYLCPPPPLLELFVPLGVGDGCYESSLRQDPFILKVIIRTFFSNKFAILFAYLSIIRLTLCFMFVLIKAIDSKHFNLDIYLHSF